MEDLVENKKEKSNKVLFPKVQQPKWAEVDPRSKRSIKRDSARLARLLAITVTRTTDSTFYTSTRFQLCYLRKQVKTILS